MGRSKKAKRRLAFSAKPSLGALRSLWSQRPTVPGYEAGHRATTYLNCIYDGVQASKDSTRRRLSEVKVTF